MPKDWVKNYFTHGRFPKVGQKQKTEKKKREREKEREKERKYVIIMAKLTHGARKHAWRTQAAWAKKIVCLKPLNIAVQLQRLLKADILYQVVFICLCLCPSNFTALYCSINQVCTHTKYTNQYIMNI